MESPRILSQVVEAWVESRHTVRGQACTRRKSAGMQRTEIIYAEQIRLLYANAPGRVRGDSAECSTAALIQWQGLLLPRLLSWVASMLALTALRAVLVWRFQHSSPAPPAMGRVGHPLWPGDSRRRARLGQCWRVVISCCLGHASGVSGVYPWRDRAQRSGCSRHV